MGGHIFGGDVSRSRPVQYHQALEDFKRSLPRPGWYSRSICCEASSTACSCSSLRRSSGSGGKNSLARRSEHAARLIGRSSRLFHSFSQVAKALIYAGGGCGGLSRMTRNRRLGISSRESTLNLY